MKNFRRSKKALSPVVASIILIAVTVAVSIAVAAWMGALTVGFMSTEQVKITGVSFSGNNQLAVDIMNTGDSAVTISEIRVGTSNDLLETDITLEPSEQGAAIVPFNYVNGTSYQVKAITSKGNPFVYTATAPT
jgi:flagellin-like protein